MAATFLHDSSSTHYHSLSLAASTIRAIICQINADKAGGGRGKQRAFWKNTLPTQAPQMLGVGGGVECWTLE